MDKKQKKLNSLSERLIYALNLIGTRKADLARSINVKPQVIQFLCNSTTKSSKFTFEIATVLGLNTRWLATGEGAMFLADDPKHTISQDYKYIPILTNEQIIKKAMGEEIIYEDEQKWTVLKTEQKDIFCMKIMDSSMEPTLPNNAIVFIKEVEIKYKPMDGDILLVYLEEFNTLVLRGISVSGSDVFLTPKNQELFRRSILSQNQKFLGFVFECHWEIRSKKP